MDLPVDHGVGRMGVAFRKRCLAAGAPWVHTAHAPQARLVCNFARIHPVCFTLDCNYSLIPLDLFKFAYNLFLEHSFIHRLN
jgi:hypothetical protein